MYKQSQLQHHATNLTPLSVLLPEVFCPFVLDFALVAVLLEGPAWSVESPASSSARFRVVFLPVLTFLELSSGPSHSSNVAPLIGISSMNIHIDFITRSFDRISLCKLLTCFLNAQIWSARSSHEHFCILASKTPAHMNEKLIREIVDSKKKKVPIITNSTGATRSLISVKPRWYSSVVAIIMSELGRYCIAIYKPYTCSRSSPKLLAFVSRMLYWVQVSK